MYGIAIITLDESSRLKVTYSFNDLIELFENDSFNPNVNHLGDDVWKLEITDIPSEEAQNKIVDLVIVVSDYFTAQEKAKQVLTELKAIVG